MKTETKWSSESPILTYNPKEKKRHWYKKNNTHTHNWELSARKGTHSSPLLCRLRSSLRQKQHAVLFLMPNWNLRWGDGLVGLWRHMTPLWGFSRPSPGFVYKVFWRDPWTWSLMVDRLRLGFWAVTIWCFSPHRCRHQSRWWILECRSGRLLGRLRGNLISSKILCDNLTDVISKCDQSMGPGHLAHPLSLWRRGQLLLWRRWFLLWSIVM